MHVHDKHVQKVITVILLANKSLPHGFQGSKKSLCPVFFKSKKKLVMCFIKKSVLPVTFGVK